MARGDYRTYYLSSSSADTVKLASYTPSGSRKEMITGGVGTLRFGVSGHTSGNENAEALVGLVIDSSITLTGITAGAWITTVEV